MYDCPIYMTIYTYYLRLLIQYYITVFIRLLYHNIYDYVTILIRQSQILMIITSKYLYHYYVPIIITIKSLCVYGMFIHTVSVHVPYKEVQNTRLSQHSARAWRPLTC